MDANWERTKMLFGEEAMEQLKQSHVTIYGIGGVGSFVCEGLARSGIGKFTLVDNDRIESSNINRQIHATIETVGRYKTEVMKERILTINPKAKVEVTNVFVLQDNVKDTIKDDVTYIVDALDTVTAKLAIAEEATNKGVAFIGAMGMGNKWDPTMVQVADIYETSVCPLCKVMRRELKKRGIPAMKVVYSREIPKKPLNINQTKGQNTNYEEESRKEESSLSLSRKTHKETPGSVAFVPSVAGLVIAGEVVRDVVGV